jgi:hypothetical protein
MSVNSFALARFEVSERVSARNLYRFVALIENLYSWHVLLDHMSVERVVAPTQFLPSLDEELLVNRLEIGTPNFIELFGQVQPLLDSVAWLTKVAGGALTTIAVVKGVYEIRELRAKTLKAERELKLAKEEDRLTSVPASALIREPDLQERTRAQASSFTGQELAEKDYFLQYARATASELVPYFAQQPTISVFEGVDGNPCSR